MNRLIELLEFGGLCAYKHSQIRIPGKEPIKG